MTKLTLVAAALVAAAAYTTEVSAARSNAASRHTQPGRRPIPPSIACERRTLARTPQLLIRYRLACRTQPTDGTNGRVGGLRPARPSSRARMARQYPLHIEL